ncbi:hypothetical protein EFQ99_32520 [Rhizobium vallis]|uniref:Uncharacterized protein n=2 Tax=Rhizobium vallis TaxID=634290 RepID=A0A3S0T134_9HYPH|nr:hypothetical protein EFQ99_32520 [Rhizobium vallis]
MTMLRILTGFFSLLLLSCLDSPALAADKFCPQRETILAFSDIVLADTAGLPPAVTDKYGAEAAYLKIRYTPLADQETRDLLSTLLQRNLKAVAVNDLVAAWYIHSMGYKRLRDALGVEEFDRTVSYLGISGIRALLLQEGGADILMKRFAVVPFHTAIEMNSAFNNGHGVVTASIIDQPDEFKEKIVQAADAHGLPVIAGYVAASENNPRAWDAFVARGTSTESPGLMRMRANFVRAVVGHPKLDRAPNERDTHYDMLMARALQPEESFLSHLYVLTDLDAEPIDPIAQKLTQQIRSGAIRRNGTMDAGWLFGYREAIDVFGQSKLVPALQKRTYYGRRYVRSSDALTIQDVIDRMLAVEALQPYVTGKIDAVPPLPDDVSDKMRADWPRWTEMAGKVRNGGASPILAADPATFGIVTELLFAKADQEALRAFVRRAPTGEARISVANDFAIRLDRACASYLYYPTEAGTLDGQSIFKFDTE